MRFSGVSANAIWTNTARTLTSFGTAIVVQQGANQSIAASATVNFNAAVSTRTFFNFGGKAGAAGSLTINFTDGTNTWVAVTIAAGAIGGQDSALCGDVVFWSIKNNDATNAGTYWYSGLRFVV